MAAYEVFGPLPFYQSQAGSQTERGIYAAPGSRVIYLCNAARTGDDQEITRRVVSTLATALSYCRANMNDTIVVLPGHSESVTTTPTFVAGVRIIGVGNGANRPVFRWTATTSIWTVAAADVVFSNLRLRLEGAVVVRGINVTAADVVFSGCEFEMVSGASNYATTGVEFSGSSDRGTISGCRFRGTANGTVTDGVKISGTGDGYLVQNSLFHFGGHITNGLLHVTGAATNVVVRDCDLFNTVATSQQCVVVDDVAATGFFTRVHTGVLNSAGAAASQGFLFGGTNPLIRCSQTFCDDEKSKNSILSPAVAT